MLPQGSPSQGQHRVLGRVSEQGLEEVEESFGGDAAALNVGDGAVFVVQHCEWHASRTKRVDRQAGS